MDISNNTEIDISKDNNFYNYDTFFRDYLCEIDIDKQEFPNIEKDKRVKILLESQKEYKSRYPNEYEKELKIRTEKYNKHQLEMKKAKEEYDNLKKEEIIKMVMRQTDYEYENTKELLENNNYDYLDIIKNYISGEKREKREKETTSINQQIYSQLRNFMSHQKSSIN